MSDFGFPNAQPPAATPLGESWAIDTVEQELRDQFRELFGLLGETAFDADVLGAPHLGSFDLVRQVVNHDGLVLLRGEHEEDATRYLYRAWKSEDSQGRGLHFLRTYLQLLFPNQARIDQLWHDSRFPYGDAFLINEPRTILRHFLGEPGLKLDGTWQVGKTLETPYTHTPNEETLWLTSRIRITLDLEAVANSIYTRDGKSAVNRIYPVISAVIPARLVPSFVFWMAFVLWIMLGIAREFRLRKDVALAYPWCGLVVTDDPARTWTIGRDSEAVKLPQAFGSFRVGERRGGMSLYHLQNCRIESHAIRRLFGSAMTFRAPRVGESWRRLDGAWTLSRAQAEAFGYARHRRDVGLDCTPSPSVRDVTRIRLDYPFTPRRLDRARPVDGHWRVAVTRPIALSSTMRGVTLDGFRLGRQPGMQATACRVSRQFVTLYVAPLHLFVKQLDGSWVLGQLREPDALFRHRRDVPLETAPLLSTRFVEQIRLDYPFTPRRLDRHRAVDGHWRVGGLAPIALSSTMRGVTLDGFRLGRSLGRCVEID